MCGQTLLRIVSIPESTIMSRHLNTLAAAYPSTKFVSIRGDMCIANYPDKNIPTLLIYRKGHLVKQIIGLGGDVGLKGMKTSVLGGCLARYSFVVVVSGQS